MVPAVVDASKVDIHVVRAFLASLAPGPQEKFDRPKARRAERIFSLFADDSRIEKDPLLLIHSPKQEKPLPDFLSVDDVFHLLGAIKVKTRLDAA